MQVNATMRQLGCVSIDRCLASSCPGVDERGYETDSCAVCSITYLCLASHGAGSGERCHRVKVNMMLNAHRNRKAYYNIWDPVVGWVLLYVHRNRRLIRDGSLDFHTAPELWWPVSFYNLPMPLSRHGAGVGERCHRVVAPCLFITYLCFASHCAGETNMVVAMCFCITSQCLPNRGAGGHKRCHGVVALCAFFITYPWLPSRGAGEMNRVVALSFFITYLCLTDHGAGVGKLGYLPVTLSFFRTDDDQSQLLSRVRWLSDGEVLDRFRLWGSNDSLLFSITGYTD